MRLHFRDRHPILRKLFILLISSKSWQTSSLVGIAWMTVTVVVGDSPFSRVVPSCCLKALQDYLEWQKDQIKDDEREEQ